MSNTDSTKTELWWEIVKISAGATALTIFYFLILSIGWIAEIYYYEEPVRHISFGGAITYSYFLTGLGVVAMGLGIVCIASAALALILLVLRLIGNEFVIALKKQDS